jgi:hypothetical protein
MNAGVEDPRQTPRDPFRTVWQTRVTAGAKSAIQGQGQGLLDLLHDDVAVRFGWHGQLLQDVSQLPSIFAHATQARPHDVVEAAGHKVAFEHVRHMPNTALAGAAWIAAANTLMVSAQLTLPKWVRARGMSIYQVALMDGTAAGAWLWG